ncbi:hypothetical protein [Nitrosomonas oligotropha]|uniref:Uncharacterized protein n=1 Tax=Nitrosomonas oligotropha TaxID=42354 RepID=A0A1H8NAC4_9PROT|nr:hypothetical protein [Nitrosomonas oligotropha]SDX07572.1 hypothetical protein SAMN05216300_11737 [Nitrosomonas oligotropha]SEO26555.1 hypothetical protein SAMN05216333_10737 [Nitrosomonas oligotropha]
MNLWEIILISFSSNTILLGVLGWLARSLLGQLVAKDLERFKSELTNTSIVTAEKLKHELHLIAQEQQVLVSKLHEKRAQVIAEVYGLLVEAQWAAQDFVSPMELVGEPSKREKYITAMNKAAEFYRCFDKNRIYLPSSLCEKLDAFIKAMRTKVIDFGVYIRLDESKMSERTLEKKYEAWDNASEYFNTEVPKARTALELELRIIIGVNQKGNNEAC